MAFAKCAQGWRVFFHGAFSVPWKQCAFLQGKTAVRRDKAGLEIIDRAEAHAAGAGARRRIERKELRLRHRHGDMAVRTARRRGIDVLPLPFRPVRLIEDNPPVGFLQGQLN